VHLDIGETGSAPAQGIISQHILTQSVRLVLPGRSARLSGGLCGFESSCSQGVAAWRSLPGAFTAVHMLLPEKTPPPQRV
jgi:hypothetical protein